MTKSMTCSYCGASDTILCKQPHGYSSVTLADKKMAFMAFNGQTLYHEICKNGSIISVVGKSTVEIMEPFLV